MNVSFFPSAFVNMKGAENVQHRTFDTTLEWVLSEITKGQVTHHLCFCADARAVQGVRLKF